MSTPPNLVGPNFQQSPYARMGYVGSLQMSNLPSTATPVLIRVTSCDIKASQNIKPVEVIDGRIDVTLYQIEPIMVGGSVDFPLVHEGAALGGNYCGSTNPSLAPLLWQIAAQRDGYGRMVNVFNSDVRYADNTAFSYPGCLINTMTFTITQQAEVKVQTEIFGGVVTAGTDARETYAGSNGLTFLSPARVITWNDAQIELYDDNGGTILKGNELQEFTCKIDNDLERVYTMNGYLGPQDIAAKKRKITGTLKIMGLNSNLDSIAYNNAQQFTTQKAIAFGYQVGNQVNPYWATALFGVIFELEDMSLQTGVFTTSTKWTAMGDCLRDYLATALGTGRVLGYPSTGSGGSYGQSSAPNFPAF